MSDLNSVPRKGFRQQKAPTKGEVLEENATLAQKLQQEVGGLKSQVMFMGNILGQLMNQVRGLGPEVEALSTLEASVVMPAGETAQRGDLVMIDYTGVLLKDDGSVEIGEDGLENRFQGGSGLKFVIRGLGSGQLIPGFEEAIIGKRAGDTFEITTTFPENYGSKELAKRTAKFLITVQRVNRMLPFSPVEKIVRDFEVKKTEILRKRQAEAAAEAKASSAVAQTAETPQPAETTPETAN